VRWLLVGAVACYSPATLSSSVDGATGMDGSGSGSDASVDAGPGCVDSFFLGTQICNLGSDDFESGANIDDNCSRTIAQSGGDALCVITGNNVTLTNLSVHGTRPVAFVALHTLIVDTLLNVSSPGAQGDAGAGGNFAGCGLLGSPGGVKGGGAGGSFAGSGADGVPGSTDQGGTAAVHEPIPMFVRGGCPGGAGGGGAAGGDGGGGVYLLAGETILVTASAQILANGQSGSGGSVSQGGGGGGTGGLIVLEAPSVSLDASVMLEAFGAGGGGGGGDVTGGFPGKGCRAGDPGTGNLGGSGAAGTDGGGCSPPDVDAKPPVGQADGGGGGGGGGGAGYILVHTATPLGPVNGFPAPIQIP